jgi:integrase/recombinase XerD
MAAKGKRMGLPEVGRPGDLQGLTHRCRAFLDWLGVKGYTKRTVRCRERELRWFLRWCKERGLERIGDISRSYVERYQRHLAHRQKENGDRLSVSTQRGYLEAVKSLFSWLSRTRQVLHNPTSELELPRLPQRLPRHVLSEWEAEQVLAQANTTELEGKRDRAILEVLYSTGMRRFEVCGLGVNDIDVQRGTVLIRQGKGSKDRYIPVGERALEWVRRYLREVRPELVREPDSGVMFLSTAGAPLNEDFLTNRVGQYVRQAELGKTGACHLFRHTMATLMLENGADVRFIQEMLGHARLGTTELYTRVSIRQLKAVHTATHPAEQDPAGEGGSI